MRRPGRLILVLGGARSGKSAVAERLLAERAGRRPITYLATCIAGDDEMRARVALHRQRRPRSWRTVEEPLQPERALATIRAKSGTACLLDCATLWTFNVMNRARGKRTPSSPAVWAKIGRSVERAIAKSVRELRTGFDPLVIVSNEIGSGLVPADPESRAFRDLMGRVNQSLAMSADEVYVCVAGLRQRWK